MAITMLMPSDGKTLCTAYVVLVGEDPAELGWEIVRDGLEEDWMMHLSVFSTELKNRARIGIYTNGNSYELFIAVDGADLGNLPTELKSFLSSEGWHDYPLSGSAVSWSMKPEDSSLPTSIESQLKQLLSLFTCRGLMSIRFPDAERINHGF